MLNTLERDRAGEVGRRDCVRICAHGQTGAYGVPTWSLTDEPQRACMPPVPMV